MKIVKFQNSNSITSTIAAMIVIFCFGILYISLFLKTPLNEYKMIIVNGAITLLTIVSQFYFGNSKSMSDRMKAENPTEIISSEKTISQTKSD